MKLKAKFESGSSCFGVKSLNSSAVQEEEEGEEEK